MQTNNVNISALYGLEGQSSLDCFAFGTFCDDSVVEKRPALIVVPGGGYAMVSKREGEPIAAYFMAKGYNTFILTYSVAPVRYPSQLLQLAATVDYLHKHAEEYNIDEQRIYMVGFSAGGHLVGNFATDYFNINERFGKDWNLSATAVCLSYPVISCECGHVDSFNNLFGSETDVDKVKFDKVLNLNRAVTDKTLPSFVWTTFEDNCVPPINSLRYAEAMIANGVQCELHMYPQGWHGLSTCDALCNDQVQPFFAKNNTWLALCEQFFALFPQNK